MRVGIQLPEVERDVRWPEYVAMASAAEEVGFDSIWLGDHLLYRDGRERGPWDVWTQLAGLAAVTERVTLGPLVAATAFHSPEILARTAASVDELSGGRVVLGIGAGWNEVEFRAFGLPFAHRVSRFEEAFEIVRRLLAGETVSYSVPRVDERRVHPHQRVRVVRAGDVLVHGAHARGSFVRLRARAEDDRVEGRHRPREPPPGLGRVVEWATIPAATTGCAACIRSARPPPSISTLSRPIVRIASPSAK